MHFFFKCIGCGRYNRRFGTSPACCGTRVYDSRFRICCNGVIKRRSGISPACCGTQVYDSRSSICCNGVIYPRSDTSPACCGTQVYDLKSSICCNGVIYPRSDTSPACCGTQVYDLRSSICCNGVINQRSGRSPDCCGTRVFDSRFHRCCNGRIQRRCGKGWLLICWILSDLNNNQLINWLIDCSCICKHIFMHDCTRTFKYSWPNLLWEMLKPKMAKSSFRVNPEASACTRAFELAVSFMQFPTFMQWD